MGWPCHGDDSKVGARGYSSTLARGPSTHGLPNGLQANAFKLTCNVISASRVVEVARRCAVAAAIIPGHHHVKPRQPRGTVVQSVAQTHSTRSGGGGWG